MNTSNSEPVERAIVVNIIRADNLAENIFSNLFNSFIYASASVE